MTFDFRVMRSKTKEGNLYTIHEVYYQDHNQNDATAGWTERDVSRWTYYSEDDVHPAELMGDFGEWMTRLYTAFDKEVMEYGNTTPTLEHYIDLKVKNVLECIKENAENADKVRELVDGLLEE